MKGCAHCITFTPYMNHVVAIYHTRIDSYARFCYKYTTAI